MIVESWVPHDSDYLLNNIVLGLTLYTDITIMTTNPIPKDGKIEFKFDDVNVHETNWKYDEDLANPTKEYCYV